MTDEPKYLGAIAVEAVDIKYMDMTNSDGVTLCPVLQFYGLNVKEGIMVTAKERRIVQLLIHPSTVEELRKLIDKIIT